ncbi:MAG: cobalamin B12-binding domain-containing protein [Bacilli bacterium]|nr:cobalamin B12-binding domain-containing protein [Bacilli bacterium]MBN2696509.1 cobalamin B12-binding domain-containing protein [Bacilli bacterium]
MDEKNYQKFIHFLELEDKDSAVEHALELLANPNNDLKDVYENLLARSLHEFQCTSDNEKLCIWKEHARTSIIRTILEASYGEVIKRKPKDVQKKVKVVVVCPQEEFHEIGAIMITNYFSLVGFDAMYVGANTPTNDIVMAVQALNPDYIAFSVTDYYNLVVTKKVTDRLKERFPELKIIVGGQAFLQPGALEQVFHDHHIRDFAGIQTLAKAVFK